jgi:hypothetical protein
MRASNERLTILSGAEQSAAWMEISTVLDQ